jgi:hypothetical protein
VVLSGLDAVIQSETGSGKTLSFLVPALSVLSYPPDIYPDDLEGPQVWWQSVTWINIQHWFSLNQVSRFLGIRCLPPAARHTMD